MKTDAQLQQDVIAELAWEASVNATKIGVEVKDSVVTLAGRVDSFAEKWEAERAALRVSGVKALAIEIDVTLPGACERTDADIARAAENMLDWMTYAPSDRIKVMVEGGWVTLSGDVDWEYQRQSVASSIRQLMGVTGVSDHIEIKEHASLGEVKTGIESALERRAQNGSKDITVAVSGDCVTLAGSVPTWSDRDVVKHAAWSAPGVRRVVDNMSIGD